MVRFYDFHKSKGTVLCALLFISPLPFSFYFRRDDGSAGLGERSQVKRIRSDHAVFDTPVASSSASSLVPGRGTESVKAGDAKG